MLSVLILTIVICKKVIQSIKQTQLNKKMYGSEALGGLLKHLPLHFPESDDIINPIPRDCDIQDVIYNRKRIFDEADKKRFDTIIKYLENSLGLKQNDRLYICFRDLALDDIKIPKGKVVWIKQNDDDKKEVFLLTDKDGRNPTYKDGKPCPSEWTENAIRNYIAIKNI